MNRLLRPLAALALTLAFPLPTLAAAATATAPSPPPSVVAPPQWLRLSADRATAVPQVAPLLDALRHAADVGLDPADYAGDALTVRLQSLLAHASAASAPLLLAWEADFNAMLTRYVGDVHFGRVDPADLGHGLRVDRSRLDIPAAIAALSTAQDPRGQLAALEPTFEHYAFLKLAMSRYRQLAADPTLTALPPLPARNAAGKKLGSLRVGDAWEGLPALARLLRAVGDLPADAPAPAPGAPYDVTLAAAVQAFQGRHGLDADGAIGPGTWRALTTPLSTRVRTMELTLERWRWVPPRLDAPPIVVNIPQFRLFAFETTRDREDRLLKMDVIVGERYLDKHTPVFSGDLRYLVFRPYWDVPYSIATRELLPKIRANAGYMARERLELVRGRGDRAPVVAATPENLAAVRAGTVRIRQRPGGDNALGLVKFMLPNPYNVYLHSTPAQSLFKRTSRAFSHGCVRVSEPARLAAFLLRDLPAWTPEAIDAAMAADAPDSRIVTLPKPVRVYFVYATALAAEAGVNFFPDVYGHDAELDARLRQKR